MKHKDGFDWSLKIQEAEKLTELTVCHTQCKATCRQMFPFLFTHQNQLADFQSCSVD